MNKKLLFAGIGLVFSMTACHVDDDIKVPFPVENPADFTEIREIMLSGGEGAAEISAYDPDTKRLFVINNAGNSRVDVVNMENPAAPELIQSIDITLYG